MTHALRTLLPLAALALVACGGDDDDGAGQDGGPPPLCGATVPRQVVTCEHSGGPLVSDGSRIYFQCDAMVTSTGAQGDQTIQHGPGSWSQTLDGLAIDDTHVYWPSGSSVYRSPKAGGDATMVMAADTSVAEVAVHQSQLYWADWDGSVWTAGPTGTDPEPTLLTTVEDAFADLAFAGDTMFISAAGEIRAYDLTGTDQGLFADIDTHDLAVHGDHLYVFGTELGRLPITGGDFERLYTGQSLLGGPAFHQGALYLSEIGDTDLATGRILRFDLASAGPPSCLAADLDYPAGIGVVGNQLLFARHPADGVYAIPVP